MTFIETIESSRWNKFIRWSFWIVGIILGAIVSYTTRHHITGDAIPYIELGKSFTKGDLWGVVNLTWSPAYAVLIGFGQLVLHTNPLNEMIRLKAVNFVIFIGAMASCDFLLAMIRRQYANFVSPGKRPLPFALIAGVTYAILLFVTIDWIRISYITPDMMALAFFLTSTGIVVWIRQSCQSYSKFALLGLATGFGFLTKAYFMPMSLVFFGASYLACASWRKALSRLLLSLIVMAVVSAPLIWGLSKKANRFSYGEAGNFNYAKNMGKKGMPIHPPTVLSSNSEVTVYIKYPFKNVTEPYSHDLAWWHLGESAVFNLGRQVEILLGCLAVVVADSPCLLLTVCVWSVFHALSGFIRIGKIWPVPLSIILLILGLTGFSLFCLVQIQMRYIAPFPIVAFLGLFLMPRYSTVRSRTKFVAIVLTVMLLLLAFGLTLNSVVDQSFRCLRSTKSKISRKVDFMNMLKIKDYLHNSGIGRGSYVGLVGKPEWYWARIAGVQIKGRICGLYGHEAKFFALTPEQRAKAIQLLRPYGIRALIGRGSAFSELAQEGWRPIPKVKDYYIYLYTPQKQSGMPTPSQRHS